MLEIFRGQVKEFTAWSSYNPVSISSILALSGL